MEDAKEGDLPMGVVVYRRAQFVDHARRAIRVEYPEYGIARRALTGARAPPDVIPVAFVRVDQR